MMIVEEIRENLKEFCERINKLGETEKPIVGIPKGATGSAAGLPFERWFQSEISKGIRQEVFGRLDFVNYFIKNHLDTASPENLWWWTIQQITPETIRRVKKGEEPKLQQAMGDIIIKYGEDLNDVVLINVKATEVSNGEPIGRAPNIVSAFRLLNFFVEMFDEKPRLVDKVNVWLVGFDYNPIGKDKVRIRQCHFKDLFRLDLDEAPELNFDAAIQIQWHLGDMIEDEKQALEEFAVKLAEKYRTEWKDFTKRRDKKLEEIINKLFSAIKKSHV